MDRPGWKYQRMWAREAGMQVDLFNVRPPAQWGLQLAIRTGPGEFSKMLVTKLRDRGLRAIDGEVVNPRTGESLPCPTEEKFFALCGVAWLRPEHRTPPER